MKQPRLYGPARPDLVIPMPDRGNRPVPAGGIVPDFTMNYYRRLRDDGDLVEIKPAPRPLTATEPDATRRSGKTRK